MGNNFSSQIPDCPILSFGENKSNDLNNTITDKSNAVLKNISSAVKLITQSDPHVKTTNNLLNSLDKEESQALIQYLFKNLQHLHAFSDIQQELKIITTGRKKMANQKLAQKHLGVISVLRSCEKLFALFFDDSFDFWVKPIESTQYFISFTTIYLETILLTVWIHPSFRNAAKEILRRISTGIEKFKDHVVATRLSYIVASDSKLPKNDLTKTEIKAMITFLEQKQKVQWYLEWDSYFVLKVGDSFPSVRSCEEKNAELVPWKYLTTTDPYISTLTKLKAFLSYKESCEELYSSQFESIFQVASALKIALH